MGLGDHSTTFLLLELYCWSTPSCLKVVDGMGWWGGGMGAHVIIVSALGPHFGLGLRLGPGFDNNHWIHGKYSFYMWNGISVGLDLRCALRTSFINQTNK